MWVASSLTIQRRERKNVSATLTAPLFREWRLVFRVCCIGTAEDNKGTPVRLEASSVVERVGRGVSLSPPPLPPLLAFLEKNNLIRNVTLRARLSAVERVVSFVVIRGGRRGEGRRARLTS